ncbi:uncharacterized protein BXIN_1518 [Babesia sp. Xinjiang]|uniref:uncharacterized protein n=1 Tax=Babesia sp. Xinjiang TaxID=462227 RepID=UPI000A21EA91|nr:uncharacterized protein BXIN_1518 [Babesia sp. Xinjiang]ORM42173.1 hypothetical protein BXIN_1518 [Babesia sp. Xinjiang]
MDSSKWMSGTASIRVSRISLGSMLRHILLVVLFLAATSFDVTVCVSLESQQRQSSPTAAIKNTTASNAGSPSDSSSHTHGSATPVINVHRVNGNARPFGGKSLPSWDYARHGADWTSGVCKIGGMQSPVDLHVEGLVTRSPQNLKSLFESVLKNKSFSTALKDGWKRGDIVYSYRPLISSVQVLRTDKVFRLSIPANEGSAFGTLFTTDRPNLYMATHIEFHSPSEHTFEGSANRRQVEVQIWHYYGDDVSSDTGIHGLETNEHTDMNVLVNTHELTAGLGKNLENVVGHGPNTSSRTSEDAVKPNRAHSTVRTPASHGGTLRSPNGSAKAVHNGTHRSVGTQTNVDIPSGSMVDYHASGSNVTGENSSNHISINTGSSNGASLDMRNKPSHVGGHKHDVATETDVVDTTGHNVNADTLFHVSHLDNASKVEGSSVYTKSPGSPYDASKGHMFSKSHSMEDHGAHGNVSHHVRDSGVHVDISDDFDVEDGHEDDFDESDDLRSANYVDDSAGASFIEIASDVEMPDGTHIISPASGQGRFRTHGSQQTSDMKELGDSSASRASDDKKSPDSGKNASGSKSHPLRSRKSRAVTDLVENEKFELLHKYLLDHLHNAAYDEDRDHRHVSGKRRARDVGTHWGRWAVLSMTFMSEEMDRTRIETLKSFPSERFMEQVLKVGSEVPVAEESNVTSVGDLGSGGSSELPVVELETPINLSSLLLMLETKNLNYFAYDGSFTHPGCEETVRWYVAKEPLPISTELMLQIHRMLNQTRETTAHSAPINKYRELQNVNSNMHNAGKVHLVHAYPIEYFVAASLNSTQESPLTAKSGLLTQSFGLCVAVMLIVFFQL